MSFVSSHLMAARDRCGSTSSAESSSYVSSNGSTGPGSPPDHHLSSSAGSPDDHRRLRQSNSSRYKTELCRAFEEYGTCKYGEKCQFAHGIAELRSLCRHPKYKTELCRTFHTEGFCPYGKRCHFVHTPKEELAAGGGGGASVGSAPVEVKMQGMEGYSTAGSTPTEPIFLEQFQGLPQHSPPPYHQEKQGRSPPEAAQYHLLQLQPQELLATYRELNKMWVAQRTTGALQPTSYHPHQPYAAQAAILRPIQGAGGPGGRGVNGWSRQQQQGQAGRLPVFSGLA